MNWRIATVVALVWMLAGCAEKLPRADLGVDVYLHPEAASLDDVLLQSAIRKKIDEKLAGRAGLIHVRVIDKVVFLSGSVAKPDDKVLAKQTAQEINLKLDDQNIRPAGEIHDERLLVAK